MASTAVSTPTTEGDISSENKESPELIEEKIEIKGQSQQDEPNDGENCEEAEEVEEPVFLHNLCILPPLQKDNFNPSTLAKDSILLPSIAPSEPVSAIRSALGEFRGYAHITNYRLVIEDIDEDLHQSIVDNSREKVKDETSSKCNNANNVSGNKKKKKKSNNGNSGSSLVSVEEVVSPYTTNKAKITVASSMLSLNKDPMNDTDEEKSNEEVVLNDFGDLSPYVEAGLLDSNMGFRMILERYDVGLVREHVNKTRFLLNGNPPSVLRVVGDEEAKEEENQNTGNVKVNGSRQEKKDKETKITEDPSEMKLPDIPLNKPVGLNGRNLKDFFYLACGEEERLKIMDGEETSKFINIQKNKQEDDGYGKDVIKNEVNEAQKAEIRWVELDDMCNVQCPISFGGFNPPPPYRRLLGDLAYLEIQLPDNEGKIHITAIPAGFYVNRSTVNKFDPAPATEPCFSHELLDCLLQYSNSLRYAWSNALKASIERSDFAASNKSPVDALFRAVVRRDLSKTITNNNAQQLVDTVSLRPSWLVHNYSCNESCHLHNIERAEEELLNTHGIDIGSGVARDWNEELQSAREMPTETLNEKIERARIIHKTLVDFGDAAAAGAMAIFKGQIAPMNPNEQSRSHVYLHNNIFFSRAIDAGVDTFKICQGDLCARKLASRDAHSVGTLHRLDIPGLHTLATVMIDYLGTRLVCQSIVPGILQGDKTHEILYGAVEATSTLSFDKDLHETLDKKIGKELMIASRNVPKSPLSQKRLDYIEERKTPPIVGMITGVNEKKEDESEDPDGITPFFGPIEMKGIRGSDKRTYCLDITRLTPRDANFVPKELGGTGNCEAKEQNKNSHVPNQLDDNEWIMAVLRPELVTHLTHKKMREWIEGKKKDDAKTENSKDDPVKDVSEKAAVEKVNESVMSDAQYMNSLRMNLNVFLPHLKSKDTMATEDMNQLYKDEALVRDAADYLWNTLLPRITQDIRSSKSGTIPVDGRGLTDFLHQRGVNCRYLGRLGELALEEENSVKNEDKDISEGKETKLQRHKMPECWLELLECEMVTRAAKHVLDRYLVENGCLSASRPADLIASFLSALMITSEESAADTENRLSNATNNDDNQQSSHLVLDIDDNVSLKRGRSEIWNDIEKEIGRRFRYSLRLYNSKDGSNAKRAQYIPLLRRVCQKAGIRLKARNYPVGGKGLVSSTVSYPIDVSDIVEVVPLVKHAASCGDDGFVPCASGAAAASTSLHILLPEAKAAFDAAQVHLNERRLQSALDIIQEASSLYQSVVESPFHNRVYRCLELTSIILFQAQEFDLALSNANKALAIAIQIGGFDSKEVLSSRTILSHILLNVGSIASAVKQQRSTMYLMELMAGPRYVELSNSYHKLGTIYHEVGSLIHALRFYQEAFGRNNPDRVIEGMLSKHSASILASLGQYRPAVETERRTYEIFRMALGEDHDLTKSSLMTMKHYTKSSVQQLKEVEAQKAKLEEEQQKIADEEAAVVLGNKIVADEVAAEERKKKKKKKGGKKK